MIRRATCSAGLAILSTAMVRASASRGAGRGQEGAKTTPKQSPPHQRVLSVCEPTVAALLAAGNRYLEDAVKAAFAGDYSAPAYLGVFFRNKWAGGAPWMGIIRVQLANGRLVDAGGDAHWQSAIFTHATVENMASSQRGSTASAGLLQRWVQVAPRFSLMPRRSPKCWAGCRKSSVFMTNRSRRCASTPNAQRPRMPRSRGSRSLAARMVSVGGSAAVNPADLGAAPFRLFQINQDNNFFVFDAGLKLVFDRLNVVPLIEDQLAAPPEKGDGRGGAVTARRPATRAARVRGRTG